MTFTKNNFKQMAAKWLSDRKYKGWIYLQEQEFGYYTLNNDIFLSEWNEDGEYWVIYQREPEMYLIFCTDGSRASDRAPRMVIDDYYNRKGH